MSSGLLSQRDHAMTVPTGLMPVPWAFASHRRLGRPAGFAGFKGRVNQTDGIWTLADDPDYALTQSSVRKMASTILEMQTAWTITAPDADSAYGLDAPDVTATLSFTDGTSLTVRFGTASASDDSLCYLASSDAPTLVYEVNADHKSAFAVTKESLHDDTATAETAADTDVVAQYPVGGENDYADSLPD